MKLMNVHFLLGPLWKDADKLRGVVTEPATKPAEDEADTCCQVIWAKRIPPLLGQAECCDGMNSKPIPK